MPLNLLQSLLGRMRPAVPHANLEGDSSLQSVPAERPVSPVRTVLRPLPGLVRMECAGVEVVAFTNGSPAKTAGNEDAWLVEELSDRAAVLAVADGLGGHRGGGMASQMLVERMQVACRRLKKFVATTTASSESSDMDSPPRDLTPSPGALQLTITEAVDAANRSLLRRATGSATTLALVELRDGVIRSYHVGDSEVLVVGQRGRIKHRTVSHSPVGYAQYSGLLSEAEALVSPERHVVDNVIGMPTMRIELGPRLRLASRDTVLIASDGLFDNLWQEELVDLIRKGPLEEAVRNLVQLVHERMTFPSSDQPSKPDDLTLIAFRLLKPLDTGETHSAIAESTQVTLPSVVSTTSGRQ